MRKVCGYPIMGNPNRPCQLPPHPEHVKCSDKLADWETNEFYDNLVNDPTREQEAIYRSTC